MLHHVPTIGLKHMRGLTGENGQRLRILIRSRGNTLPLEEMYKEWREKHPKIDLAKSQGSAII